VKPIYPCEPLATRKFAAVSDIVVTSADWVVLVTAAKLSAALNVPTLDAATTVTVMVTEAVPDVLDVSCVTVIVVPAAVGTTAKEVISSPLFVQFVPLEFSVIVPEPLTENEPFLHSVIVPPETRTLVVVELPAWIRSMPFAAIVMVFEVPVNADPVVPEIMPREVTEDPPFA
jgi:hypothetical protein